MRDRKYKGWIHRLNRFADSVTIYSDGSWSYEINNGDCIVGGSSAKKDKLIEYIGRKDRKGKEIYEGDIMLDGNGFITKVEHDLSPIPGFYLFWRNGKKAADMIDSNYIEVIGNIFENPELLEV